MKNQRLEIRVSEEEAAAYQAQAFAAGMKLTEWIRSMLAGGKPEKVPRSESEKLNAAPVEYETCTLCNDRDSFLCPRCQGTGKIKRRA